MNIYVKINSIKYPITQYSYRVNNVANDTKLSHIFSCNVVSDNTTIVAGDTIEFYSDDILIYSDPINTVIVNAPNYKIQSEKEINAPVSKDNLIADLFYYSSTQIRTSLNFLVLPLDTLTTAVGNFNASTVVHNAFTTEVTID